MTVDERLERLTERHEALTQTVESLAHTVHELANSVGRLDGRVKLLFEITLRIGADFAERLRRLEAEE